MTSDEMKEAKKKRTYRDFWYVCSWIALIELSGISYLLMAVHEFVASMIGVACMVGLAFFARNPIRGAE